MSSGAVNFNGTVVTGDGVEANVLVWVDEGVIRTMAEALNSDFPEPLLRRAMDNWRYHAPASDDDPPEDDGGSRD